MSRITDISGYDQYLEFLNDRAGGFLTSLFDCISHADDENRLRLSFGFPSHVDAYRLYTEISRDAFLAKVTPTHPLLKYYRPG